MSVFQIALLAVAAFIIGRLKKGRELSLLAFSVFVIYWLQPAQGFVSLTFWLPTATIFITIFTWLVTSPPETRSLKQNLPAGLVIFGAILLVDLNQFFSFDQIYMTTTPRLGMIALGLIVVLAVLFATNKAQRFFPFLMGALFIGFIFLFIYIKTPYLINSTFEYVNTLRGSSSTSNLFSWLGYSYAAFRLIHIIRDKQANRLPTFTLGEFVNYVIFFPSFTAGPIDRAERFMPELRNPAALADQDWAQAGTRLFIGLFKKFVIADALAVISISDVLIGQVDSPLWLWFFLYAYAFRIYYDFSGYTDIAIGLARMLGIRLPENFNAPFLKPNLAQFWNAWHMTLTQWFRAYFFNPVTRSMRSKNYSVAVIILFTQIATMLMIGLWHGVSWNFVLWGLWHGLGLFIQNRWSEFMRTRIPLQTMGGWALTSGGIFLTFNFFALGLLFFALSTPALAWTALLKLFGLS